MAIFGNVIKGYLDLRNKLAPDTHPIEAQQKVLTSLLEKARKTAFGKQCDFEKISESEKCCPIVRRVRFIF